MTNWVRRAYYRRESDKAPGYWRECYEKLVKTKNEFDKEEWFDVCKSIRPGLSLSEFDDLWDEFVKLKTTKGLT